MSGGSTATDAAALPAPKRWRVPVSTAGTNAVCSLPGADCNSCWVATANDEKVVRVYNCHLTDPSEADSVSTAAPVILTPVCTCTGLSGTPSSLAMASNPADAACIHVVVGCSSGKMHTYIVSLPSDATAAGAGTELLPVMTASHHLDEISSLSITSVGDRSIIASLDDDSTLCISDFTTGKLLTIKNRAHDVLGSVVSFAPTDAPAALPATLTVVTGSFDQKLLVWKVVLGSLPAVEVVEEAEEDAFLSILASPLSSAKGKGGKGKKEKKPKAEAGSPAPPCTLQAVQMWQAGRVASQEVLDQKISAKKKGAAQVATAAPTPEEPADVSADGKILNPAFVYGLTWLDNTRFCVCFGDGSVAIYDIASNTRVWHQQPMHLAATAICVRKGAAEGVPASLFCAGNDGTIVGWKIPLEGRTFPAAEPAFAGKHARGPNAMVALPLERAVLAVVDVTKYLSLYVWE